MFYSHISAKLVVVNLCAIVELHFRFWKWPCIKPQGRLIIRSHYLRTLCQHVFAALALTWSSCSLHKKNTRDRCFGCFSFILIFKRNSIHFLYFKVAGIILLRTLDSNNFSVSDISPEKLKTVDFVSSFIPQLLSRLPSNTDAELKTKLSDWTSQFWIFQFWGQKIKLSVYMSGFLNFQLYSFQWEEKNELSDKIS